MEQIAGIDPEFWTVLDRVVQWLIIPALVAAWYLNRRVDSQEREILRILTILEERNQRRSEDREDSAAAFTALRGAIERLSSKIDEILNHR